MDDDDQARVDHDDSRVPGVSDDDTSTSDDYQVRMYQDEVDTSATKTDPVIPEETDDPTETLGVAPDELAVELKRSDLDGGSTGVPEDEEDMREYTEDQNQDPDGESPAVMD